MPITTQPWIARQTNKQAKTIFFAPHFPNDSRTRGDPKPERAAIFRHNPKRPVIRSERQCLRRAQIAFERPAYPTPRRPEGREAIDASPGSTETKVIPTARKADTLRSAQRAHTPSESFAAVQVFRISAQQPPVNVSTSAETRLHRGAPTIR
jgi:hypothetical protein